MQPTAPARDPIMEALSYDFENAKAIPEYLKMLLLGEQKQDLKTGDIKTSHRGVNYTPYVDPNPPVPTVHDNDPIYKVGHVATQVLQPLVAATYGAPQRVEAFGKDLQDNITGQRVRSFGDQFTDEFDILKSFLNGERHTDLDATMFGGSDKQNAEKNLKLIQRAEREKEISAEPELENLKKKTRKY